MHYVCFAGEDDFREVYTEAYCSAERYYQLGIELGLPPKELNKIRKGLSLDVDQAFCDMLLVWLRHSYDVQKYGPPTWKRLVEAVASPSGGNNHGHAITIASNHSAGELILLFIIDCWTDFLPCVA